MADKMDRDAALQLANEMVKFFEVSKVGERLDLGLSEYPMIERALRFYGTSPAALDPVPSTLPTSCHDHPTRRCTPDDCCRTNRLASLPLGWRKEAVRHSNASADDDCEVGGDEWSLHREASRIYKICANDLDDAIGAVTPASSNVGGPSHE